MINLRYLRNCFYRVLFLYGLFLRRKGYEMRTKARGAETAIYKEMANYIGARVLTARKEKGLSQLQVASSAKLSVSFLCEIEHGKTLPSLIVYSELCKHLEIEPKIPIL